VTTDADLAARNRATLLACFEENARSSRGARLVQGPGIAIAVFTTDPEARFLQNAVLDRGLGEPEALTAIAATEEAYAVADVAEFAIWTVEGDDAAEGALESRGYRFSESTLAMGMELRDLRPATSVAPHASGPAPEVAWGDWSAYREFLELAAVWQKENRVFRRHRSLPKFLLPDAY
jgi:hypothetical protein